MFARLLTRRGVIEALLVILAFDVILSLLLYDQDRSLTFIAILLACVLIDIYALVLWAMLLIIISLFLQWLKRRADRKAEADKE